jgi:hypothetical protein
MFISQSRYVAAICFTQKWTWRRSMQLNWLTPQSRVVLDKLIVAQLVKKFSTLYGTWRFVTVFTRVCLSMRHCATFLNMVFMMNC